MSRRFALRTSVPIGATIVFAMATPPLGWQQDTAFNDRVLVFTSGAGLGTAGSVAPDNGEVTSNTAGATVTGATAVSTAQLAVHAHSQSHDNVDRVGDVAIQGSGQFETHTPSTGNAGSGSTHTHTIAQHNHTVNYNFKIREVIAAKRIF